MTRMNKRGGLFFGFVVAVMVFSMGLLIANFLKPEVTNVRAVGTGLDCGNLSISDGAKLTCLGADVTIPYFIIIVVSVAGGYVASKLNL